MHRTNRVPHTAFGTMVLTLLLGNLPAPWARAADEVTPPPRLEASASANTLIIPLGSSQRVQMTDKKMIKTVVNPKENIALITPVAGDPKSVLITGRDAGSTRVTLTAVDNTEETYRV